MQPYGEVLYADVLTIEKARAQNIQSKETRKIAKTSPNNK